MLVRETRVGCRASIFKLKIIFFFFNQFFSHRVFMCNFIVSMEFVQI